MESSSAFPHSKVPTRRCWPRDLVPAVGVSGAAAQHPVAARFLARRLDALNFPASRVLCQQGTKCRLPEDSPTS